MSPNFNPRTANCLTYSPQVEAKYKPFVLVALTITIYNGMQSTNKFLL